MLVFVVVAYLIVLLIFSLSFLDAAVVSFPSAATLLLSIMTLLLLLISLLVTLSRMHAGIVKDTCRHVIVALRAKELRFLSLPGMIEVRPNGARGRPAIQNHHFVVIIIVGRFSLVALTLYYGILRCNAQLCPAVIIGQSIIQDNPAVNFIRLFLGG